ncbi:hydroxyethylthiazole kinase [uncultured Clostridium sp.]|uniref:hydroxyethylthiazole kinase n=1 Tax=uncultured Clostridium sp. TaxID=59620 RepID=UPI0025F3FEFD|nr:hydroxyethylthiazole kinase [uncultured Clostridium sp.]
MSSTNLDKVTKILSEVRNKVPLVHCITNYVTINDCANILLAYGASPAMCEAYDEVFDFVKLSSALYINLGTLNKEQEQAMILASTSAKIHNVPVILDPVACAASVKKIQVINRISQVGKIDVIKGNIGEIKSLAGQSANVRGVDSIDSGEGALESCIALSKKCSCVVAATGKKDFISDGRKSAIIENGTEMFTKITGSGCMLGALCGAACGASEDKFSAVVSAILSMNIAGEEAVKAANAPGSFRVKLMDCIYQLNEEKLKGGAKITWK